MSFRGLSDREDPNGWPDGRRSLQSNTARTTYVVTEVASVARPERRFTLPPGRAGSQVRLDGFHAAEVSPSRHRSVHRLLPPSASDTRAIANSLDEPGYKHLPHPERRETPANPSGIAAQLTQARNKLAESPSHFRQQFFEMILSIDCTQLTLARPTVGTAVTARTAEMTQSAE